MATKTPRVRLGLLVQTTTDRDSYLGDYFHVRAYPVTIGPTTWEQDYRAQRAEAGKPDDSYDKIAHDTIRNASDDLHNGLYLSGLRIDSQGANKDEPRHLYGFDVEYRDVYAVDLRKASHMAQTLKTIERKTEQLSEKYGRAASFGAYVARIANAIGADTILFIDGKDSGWHHTNGHRMDTLGDGAARIDSIVRQWIDEGLPQPPKHRQPEQVAD